MDKNLERFWDTLADPLKGVLLPALKEQTKNIGVDVLAKGAAQVILKGIDASLATVVKHLPRDKTEEFTEAYRRTISAELVELSQAIWVYMPLQLNVEWAKRVHGPKSAEADAARALRVAGIAELRQETKDLLLAAIGKDPAD